MYSNNQIVCTYYINVNLHVFAYSLISSRVQQTSQFASLVLEISLIQSHLLWGEFSCALCFIIASHSKLAFPFHQVPITAGLREAT